MQHESMSGLENSAILNSESNPNLNSTVGHNQSSKKGATTVTSGGGGPNSVSSTNKLGFNLNYNTSSKLASTNKLVGSVQVSFLFQFSLSPYSTSCCRVRFSLSLSQLFVLFLLSYFIDVVSFRCVYLLFLLFIFFKFIFVLHERASFCRRELKVGFSRCSIRLDIVILDRLIRH